MITENNIKLERLPFWRERNSLHHGECGRAAVALITGSIQPEPQVLAALRRHTASRTRAGVMNAPVSTAKCPPLPSVSTLLLLLLLAPSISAETPSRAQLRPAGRVVCAGGGGCGGLGQMARLEQLVRDACGQTMDSFCPSENK